MSRPEPARADQPDHRRGADVELERVEHLRGERRQDLRQDGRPVGLRPGRAAGQRRLLTAEVDGVERLRDQLHHDGQVEQRQRHRPGERADADDRDEHRGVEQVGHRADDVHDRAHGEHERPARVGRPRGQERQRQPDDRGDRRGDHRHLHRLRQRAAAWRRRSRTAAGSARPGWSTRCRRCGSAPGRSTPMANAVHTVMPATTASASHAFHAVRGLRGRTPGGGAAVVTAAPGRRARPRR